MESRCLFKIQLDELTIFRRDDFCQNIVVKELFQKANVWLTQI